MINSTHKKSPDQYKKIKGTDTLALFIMWKVKSMV